MKFLNHFKNFHVSIICLFSLINVISGGDFLTLTLQEKQILDQLKENVGPYLEKDYMKQEIYLLRFLRQTDFDIGAAEDLLRNVVIWREENSIESLLDEEFPEFDEEYNVYLEGCDPFNRPVISVPIGDWDLRRAILAGLQPRLIRYMDKIYEDSTNFLRTANAAGMELVQAILILDMSGFSPVTHACPRCIELYLYFMGNLQNHYPGLIERMYFVNTPDIVHVLWNMYQGVFNKKLREITTMFGRDKEQWGRRLRDEIGADQLSIRYGGDKADSLEFYYIRIAGQLISTPEQLDALNMTKICSKDVKIFEDLIREVHHDKRKEKRLSFEKKQCSKRA